MPAKKTSSTQIDEDMVANAKELMIKAMANHILGGSQEEVGVSAILLIPDLRKARPFARKMIADGYMPSFDYKRNLSGERLPITPKAYNEVDPVEVEFPTCKYRHREDHDLPRYVLWNLLSGAQMKHAVTYSDMYAWYVGRISEGRYIFKSAERCEPGSPKLDKAIRVGEWCSQQVVMTLRGEEERLANVLHEGNVQHSMAQNLRWALCKYAGFSKEDASQVYASSGPSLGRSYGNLGVDPGRWNEKALEEIENVSARITELTHMLAVLDRVRRIDMPPFLEQFRKDVEESLRKREEDE